MLCTLPNIKITQSLQTQKIKLPKNSAKFSLNVTQIVPKIRQQKKKISKNVLIFSLALLLHMSRAIFTQIELPIQLNSEIKIGC